MKKFFLLVPVAALAMTACTSESNEFVGDKQQQAREITIMPLAQKTTRAAVDGTTFTPTTMTVAAYDVTNDREFFGATMFTKDATTWKGNKYWPLSETYINFFAYSELQAEATPTLTWGATGTTATWALVMTDNKSEQKDLMYAIGSEDVERSGNTLTFPGNVPMTFKHAQAWVRFMADAYDATTGGKVTLKSITLNGAKYNGTYTVTFTNYNQNSSQTVTGAWSVLGSTADVAVPNWVAAAIAYDSSGDGVVVGDGLLIVPDDDPETADFSSFDIEYELDGKTYTYNYEPTTAALKNVDQAKKYTFKIVFHLHEIEIAPSVTNWVEGGPTSVPVF